MVTNKKKVQTIIDQQKQSIEVDMSSVLNLGWIHNPLNILRVGPLHLINWLEITILQWLLCSEEPSISHKCLFNWELRRKANSPVVDKHPLDVINEWPRTWNFKHGPTLVAMAENIDIQEIIIGKIVTYHGRNAIRGPRRRWKSTSRVGGECGAGKIWDLDCRMGEGM